MAVIDVSLQMRLSAKALAAASVRAFVILAVVALVVSLKRLVNVITTPNLGVRRGEISYLSL